MVILVPAVASLGEIPVTTGGGPILLKGQILKWGDPFVDNLSKMSKKKSGR